nr:PREDICTED: uncharacterized protein LOC102361768 [Latimeria chalumnae]|eukprot:XP_014353609.1 PREDICTED: uncharacterized protein LOC102361768 [Latimeria chalumnae]
MNITSKEEEVINTLVCETQGNLSSSLTRYKNGVQVSNKEHTFKLNKNTSRYHGNYSCTAKNAIGSSTLHVRVNMRHQPVPRKGTKLDFGIGVAIGIGISALLLAAVLLVRRFLQRNVTKGNSRSDSTITYLNDASDTQANENDGTIAAYGSTTAGKLNSQNKVDGSSHYTYITYPREQNKLAGTEWDPDVQEAMRTEFFNTQQGGAMGGNMDAYDCINRNGTPQQNEDSSATPSHYDFFTSARNQPTGSDIGADKASAAGLSYREMQFAAQGTAMGGDTDAYDCINRNGTPQQNKDSANPSHYDIVPSRNQPRRDVSVDEAVRMGSRHKKVQFSSQIEKLGGNVQPYDRLPNKKPLQDAGDSEDSLHYAALNTVGGQPRKTEKDENKGNNPESSVYSILQLSVKEKAAPLKLAASLQKKKELQNDFNDKKERTQHSGRK